MRKLARLNKTIILLILANVLNKNFQLGRCLLFKVENTNTKSSSVPLVEVNFLILVFLNQLDILIIILSKEALQGKCKVF